MLTLNKEIPYPQLTNLDVRDRQTDRKRSQNNNRIPVVEWGGQATNVMVWFEVSCSL